MSPWLWNVSPQFWSSISFVSSGSIVFVIWIGAVSIANLVTLTGLLGNGTVNSVVFFSLSSSVYPCFLSKLIFILSGLLKSFYSFCRLFGGSLFWPKKNVVCFLNGEWSMLGPRDSVSGEIIECYCFSDKLRRVSYLFSSDTLNRSLSVSCLVMVVVRVFSLSVMHFSWSLCSRIFWNISGFWWICFDRKSHPSPSSANTSSLRTGLRYDMNYSLSLALRSNLSCTGTFEKRCLNVVSSR